MANGQENLLKNIGEVVLHIIAYGILGLVMMIFVIVNWVELHYGNPYFHNLGFWDVMVLIAILAVPLMVRLHLHKNIENREYIWMGIIITVLPLSGFLITLPAVDVGEIYMEGKDILAQSIRLFYIVMLLGIPISYWIEKSIRWLNRNK